MPGLSFAAPAATTQATTNNLVTPLNDPLSSFYIFVCFSVAMTGFVC